MRSWYGRHFLIFDWVATTLLAVGLGIVVWKVPSVNDCMQKILDGNRPALYGALASIFGSLLGFSIAAVAIVLGAVQSPRLTTVRKSQHYQTLWTTFKSSVRWLAVATALSLIALAADRDTSPIPAITAILLWAGVLAATRLAHTIWILEQVISIVTQSPEV